MIDLEYARAALAPPASLQIEYARLAPGADTASLPPDVLAAIAFGRQPGAADPRLIRIPLDPLGPAGLIELWRTAGPVRSGREGSVRFTADAEHLAGVIELDERDHGGLAAAAEWAYASVRRFQAHGAHPHLLRMWNYFGSINRGEGDGERYKQFCLGRAAGLGPWPPSRFPAATAIGRRDESPILQVYWLAARSPGTPIENPRQLSAYRYPRQYGPAAPSFSRAMLADRRLLLVSGTASVVGHASQHPGALTDQLDETLANLGAILERAAAMQPALPRAWGRRTLLKVYLRDGAAAERAAARLATRLPAGVAWLMLEADICRTDLLVEIDCVHGV